MLIHRIAEPVKPTGCFCRPAKSFLLDSGPKKPGIWIISLGFASSKSPRDCVGASLRCYTRKLRPLSRHLKLKDTTMSTTWWKDTPGLGRGVRKVSWSSDHDAMLFTKCELHGFACYIGTAKSSNDLGNSQQNAVLRCLARPQCATIGLQ